SSRALQQRPRYSRPCAKPHLRSWHKKGSALLRIASVSACRAGPCDRPELNSITCVRGGRRYSRQAQGDFRDIANILSEVRVGLASIAYMDISLRSIWAIYKIRQTPNLYPQP